MAQRPPHDVLSECLERWEQGQGGVEELLAQHPALRDELEPLLGLAASLWAIPPVHAPDSLRRNPRWRQAAPRTAPELLDDCLGRGRSAAGELLAQRPELRADIEPLLGVAEQLRALPSVRAPEHLRRDPLWRRQPAATAPDLLADCLEQIERGQTTVDEVLAQHPDLRTEVARLLEVAARLRAMPKVRAPHRLRENPQWRQPPVRASRWMPLEHPPHISLPLWAAAHRERGAQPAAEPASAPMVRFPIDRRRLVSGLGRVAAGVGGAVIALTLAGTIATSATSLPDSPLYPVKRLVENAEMAFTPADSRLELHLRRAQERVKETREMAERDRPDVVASLVDEYVKEVAAVRTELQNSVTRAPEPEQVGRVVTRLEANEQVLGAIVERVPEPARPALSRAAEAARPETVAPAEAPRPAARVPASVAAPAFGSTAPAPATVREPAPALPQLSDVPSTATPMPSPSATPARVGVPSGGASILPSPTPAPAQPTATASVGGTGTAPTASPPLAPSSVPTSAPAPTVAQPTVAPTQGTAAPQPSPTSAFQLLPPISASPTAGSTNAAVPPTPRTTP